MISRTKIALIVAIAILVFFITRLTVYPGLRLADTRVQIANGLSCQDVVGWAVSTHRLGDVGVIHIAPLERCGPYVQCVGPASSKSMLTFQSEELRDGFSRETIGCNKDGSMRTRIRYVAAQGDKYFLIEAACIGDRAACPDAYYEWIRSVQFRGERVFNIGRRNTSPN